MKITISLLAILFASALGSAQEPTPTPSTPVVRHRTSISRVPKRPVASTMTNIGAASSDFFVGEAKVDVTKDETVIKLAMAQHGSVLIELPANDGPRYIIPGDPEMATVDQKALERNKRAIVVRPGAAFVPPPRNRPARAPAATVTAQMRSGLVVTFLFYPVEDLSQNVHRCVLNYNRDEVVARRHSAGLPVNLDANEERGESTSTSAATLSSTPVKEIADQKPKDSVSGAGPLPSPASKPAASFSTNVLSSSKTTAESELSSIETQTNAALAEAVKKPKGFKKWTQPVHGLSLSVKSANNQTKDLSITILGVRNTTSEAVKLLSSTPELFIETVDDKKLSINLQSIKKTRTEVSDGSGAIAAGATAYFAIAYKSPVLDAHQQVKLSVAQTNAADEPASITIAKRDR